LVGCEQVLKSKVILITFDEPHCEICPGSIEITQGGPSPRPCPEEKGD